MFNEKNQNGFSVNDTVGYIEQVLGHNPGEVRNYLIGLAQKAGLSSEESEAAADRIMVSAAQYEETRETMGTDVREAMQPFFEKLSGLPGEQRIIALDEILFGLQCASDDELYSAVMEKQGGILGIGARNSGKSVYLNRHRELPEWSPEEEARMRDEVYDQIANLRLSPKYLARLTRKFSRGEYTAAAAAFGKDGYSLKCAASMLCWLENREKLDPETAVAETCAGIDVQALGDAVRRGLIAEKVAKALLHAVVITLGVLSFIHLCSLLDKLSFASGSLDLANRELYAGIDSLPDVKYFDAEEVSGFLTKMKQLTVSSEASVRNGIRCFFLMQILPVQAFTKLVSKLAIRFPDLLHRRGDAPETEADVLEDTEEDALEDSAYSEEENGDDADDLSPAFV